MYVTRLLVWQWNVQEFGKGSELKFVATGGPVKCLPAVQISPENNTFFAYFSFIL